MNKSSNTRKRGDDLLDGLFESTLSLVREVGLTNLTFKQIAENAKTSRTVLYRRWQSTFDLLQDVYSYKVARMFEADVFGNMPDTGSLRTDLLLLLKKFQALYREIGPEVVNNYIFLRSQDVSDTKEPPAHTAAAGKYLESMEMILKRAAMRKQPVRKVSRQTLILPFDLIRLENIIRPKNISERRLIMLVDEILLPVFLK